MQVVGAGPLAVLDLGLGDGGAVVDVPERRRLGAVGLAAGQVAEEGDLAGAAADGRRSSCTGSDQSNDSPRRRNSSSKTASSVAVSSWHSSTKLGREIGTSRWPFGRVAAVRRREVGVVRRRRVAAHAVEVLHPALGGQAVVVPADRVEDGLAAHPLVAGDGVGLGVAEHGAHVERAATPSAAACRWRTPRSRVGRAVEAVGAVGLPALGPARLDAVERRLVGDRGAIGRSDTGARSRRHPPGDGGRPPHVALRAVVLRLYDTATGEVRELALREPGTVGIYLCGPTVYGPPHLGHGRATLVYDVLRRYLEWRGLDGAARLQHHRHRRQDHRPGQRRGPRPWQRDRRAVRGGVVARRWTASASPARRHPPRHRVRRPDGGDDRRAGRRSAGPTPPTTACTCRSRRSRTTACWPTSRSTTCSPAAATARCSAPSRSATRPTSCCGSWPSRASRRGRRRGATGGPGWHSECVVMSLDLLGEGFDLHCRRAWTCASRTTRTSGPRPSPSASASPTTGCTTASSSTPRARRCRRASATSTTCSTSSSSTTPRRTGCCCCRATTAVAGARRRRQPAARRERALAGLDAFAARSDALVPTSGATTPTPAVLDAFVERDGRRPRHAGRDGACCSTRCGGPTRALDAGDLDAAAPLVAAVREIAGGGRARARVDRRRARRGRANGPASSTRRGPPRTTPAPTPSAPSCRPPAGSSRRRPPARPSVAERSGVPGFVSACARCGAHTLTQRGLRPAVSRTIGTARRASRGSARRRGRSRSRRRSAWGRAVSPRR